MKSKWYLIKNLIEVNEEGLVSTKVIDVKPFMEEPTEADDLSEEDEEDD